MKRSTTVYIWLALLGSLCASASDYSSVSEADAVNLFDRAAQLYSEGNAASAADLYARILDSGYVSHALHYNRGNAELLAGDYGHAVLSYRRAWRMLPRDKGTFRGLDTALRRAGAALPRSSTPATLLRHLSLKEWVILCEVFFWLSTAVAFVAFAVKSRRRVCLSAVVVLWLLTAVSLAGAAGWTHSSLRNEAVAVVADTVRLAPGESALSSSPLPAGTIVTALEKSGKWIRISTGNRAGWVPRESIAFVREYPPSPTATGATSVGM